MRDRQSCSAVVASLDKSAVAPSRAENKLAAHKLAARDGFYVLQDLLVDLVKHIWKSTRIYRLLQSCCNIVLSVD